MEDSKKSIAEYQEQLRKSVERQQKRMAEQSEDEETEGLNDESSGYVIDYEQVLKDNSAVRRSPSPITPSDPIEDHFTMGQENDVILEQTNEAIEDDSSDETHR